MPTPSTTRIVLLGLATAVFALVGTPSAAGDEEQVACGATTAPAEEATPRPDCCFTNRAFAGVCRVTPAEDETCSSILAYLNNPQSKGKPYCGATTIRGGWQETPCEAPQAGGPVETTRH